MAGSLTLEQVLRQHTGPAAPELVKRVGTDKLRCVACGHRCLIPPGRQGVCKVRFNEGGELRVPHGYVAGLNSDPIEKKPFFHALPGTDALSFGMLGCDLHCAYCQNWITSQALRDPAAVSPVQDITARYLVDLALLRGASTVTSTYNEPLITTEWAAEVFRLAKPQGLKCAYVSNGNATPEVLAYLRPCLDMMKVDLKCYDDGNYRKLGGVLRNVLEAISTLKESGVWVEIVTLLVPGFNDSPRELRELARFIISVSPDIPWHVTAFHQDYRMTDPSNTTSEQLLAAANLGREEGIRFVYAGNLPGHVGEFENTNCPECQALLIKRFGFAVLEDHLTGSGTCPRCKAGIPGIWM